MAKSNDNIQAVKIQATELNKLSSIIRACITAGNAAAALQSWDIYDEIESIKAWAETKRRVLISEKACDNPALG